MIVSLVCVACHYVFVLAIAVLDTYFIISFLEESILKCMCAREAWPIGSSALLLTRRKTGTVCVQTT